MGNNINTKSFLDFHGLQTFWNKIKETFADKESVDRSLNTINGELAGVKINISGINSEISGIKRDITDISPKEAVNYSKALILAASAKPATIIYVQSDETISGIDYFAGFYIVGPNGSLRYIGTSSGADVEDELVLINNAINNVLDEVRSLNNDVDSLDSRVYSLENNVVTKSDINDIQSSVNDIQSSVNNLSNTVDSLDSEIDTVKNDVNAVNDKVDSLENTVNSFEDVIDTVDESINTLISDVETVKTSVSDLSNSFEGSINDVNDKVDSLGNDVENINKDIENINSALKNIPTDASLEEIRNSVSKIINNLSNTDANVAAVSSNVDALRNEVNANTQVINNVYGSIDSINSNIDNLNTSVNSINSKVDSNTQLIDGLNNTIQGLSTKEELQSSVNIVRDEISVSKEEILNEVADTYITIEKAGDLVVNINKELVENIVGESEVLRALEMDIDHIFKTEIINISNEDTLNAVAKIGGVARLFGDIELDAPVEVKGNLILDLNGHTITSKIWDEDGEANSYAFWVTDGNLIINGNGTVEIPDAVYSMAVWSNGGNVIINGGTYKNGGDSCDLIYISKSGNVTINGGEFIAAGPATGNAPGTKNSHSALNIKDANRDTCSITVRGGKFYKFNPADNVSETEHTNFVAEGYESVQDGDWFNVIKLS